MSRETRLGILALVLSCAVIGVPVICFWIATFATYEKKPDTRRNGYTRVLDAPVEKKQISPTPHTESVPTSNPIKTQPTANERLTTFVGLLVLGAIGCLLAYSVAVTSRPGQSRIEGEIGRELLILLAK
jgi:hypothetical protein